MSYVVSFPTDKEAEPYTDIETWNQAMFHVKEEIEKAIADGGSEFYDLDWGELDYTQEWFDKLSDNIQQETHQEAIERGIQNAVNAHFPRIEGKLSAVGEARLPGGIWIKIEANDE